MSIFFCILMTCLLLDPIYVISENILIMMPLPARSHFKSFQLLFEEIVKKGHNVTLISGHRLHKSLENKYSFVDVSNEFHNLGIVFAEMRKQNRLQNLIFCTEMVYEYNEHILNLSSIQKLIIEENNRFDLVFMELFFADSFIAFGYRFNAPVIGLSAQNILSYYDSLLGYSITSSYIPNLYLPFTNKMSFYDRLINWLFNIFSDSYYHLIYLPKCQKQIEKYFNINKTGKISSIHDLLNNISLIFVNSHFSLGYPRPYPPNVIETAGIHMEPRKGLPENIKKFMDDSEDGVIYFSLGSLINPIDIKEFGENVIKTLGNLPQKVVFKWNSQLLPYIPDNFLVLNWVPQIDILDHPNCRLFITHGGLHSILETVIFAVPFIGIPFFTDQQHNMIMAEYFEIGKTVNFENVGTELRVVVNELLRNPKYKNNIKYRSQLFNDRPRNVTSMAMYWVEYILRYKYVSHMKVPVANLSRYQYLLIDVFIAFVIVSLFTLSLIFLIVKLINNYLRKIIIFERHKNKITVAKKVS